MQQFTQDNAFLQRANTWKCRGGCETACAELDSILGLGLGWFTSRAVPLELSLARHVDEEASVLFIGTQFSILYTSMYSPAEAATLRA